MLVWEPISLKELEDLLVTNDWEGGVLNFWNLIKIDPVKWIEKTYGEEGEGFWVVAIYGTKVIWYNDIEEGFNISGYSTYGLIDEYCCNQDNLKVTIQRLFRAIISEEQAYMQRGVPSPLI